MNGDRYFPKRYFPNRYFPPGAPSGPVTDVFLAMSSAGQTLLVNPQLRVIYQIGLTSDGGSTVSGSLSYLHSLAAQSTGSSLLGINARIDAALATSSAGASAVSINARPERGLTLTSAGVSSTTLAMQLIASMRTVIAGSSSTSAALHLIAALSAASAGNATVIFELNGDMRVLRLGPAIINQILTPGAGVQEMNPVAAFSQILGPDADVIAQTIQAIADQSTYTATISPLGISAVVFTRPELFARITVVSESEIEQRGIVANVLPSYPSTVMQRDNPKANIS
jgi:hypothetical protein